PGFADAADVQTMRLWVPPTTINEPEKFTEVQHQVLDKIQALPGVTAAGFASTIPTEGRIQNDIVFVEGRDYRAGRFPPGRREKFVSPNFFAAMGTHIVAGRDITWTDIGTHAKVALISENFAREIWGNPARALGRHVHEPMPQGRAPIWREIIG